MEATILRYIYNGSNGVDGEEFLFTYGNVIMRGKDEDTKQLPFLNSSMGKLDLLIGPSSYLAAC